MTPIDALRADDIAHARLVAELRELAGTNEVAREYLPRAYWLPTCELSKIVRDLATPQK